MKTLVHSSGVKCARLAVEKKERETEKGSSDILINKTRYQTTWPRFTAINVH